jgi:hypothetical protein
VTDERLRALDRRRLGSGAITDEAAWLQERLRRGDLSRERLYLAAALGHPAALAALALRPRSATWVSWAWLRLAGPRLEPAAAVRVALALTLPGEERAEPALGALLRWCACPCAGHTVDVKTTEESLTSSGAWDDDALVHSLVRAACRFVSGASDELDWLFGIDLLRRSPHAPRAVKELQGLVVPWALGQGDPIALRAEAAQEVLLRLRARWEETRARSDEVAWLRGRLRAGLISADRVRLAAHLGDAASAAVLGGDAPEIDDAAAWADATGDWGLEACIRFALAVARSTVPAGSAAHPALDAADAWLSCPCEAHRSNVRELALQQENGVVRAALGWAEVTRERLIADQETAAARARELVRLANKAKGKDRDEAREELVANRARELVEQAGNWLADPACAAAVRAVTLALDPPARPDVDRLREALRRDVVPWALRIE